MERTMRSIGKWMFRSIVAVAVIAGAPGLAAADCNWTVTGQVSVEHQLPELITKFGGKSHLKGIKVQVSAKDQVFGVWGTWNSWGEVTTNANGVYSISNQKNCDHRRFKVEVKFQNDDDLEVRHEHSTSSLTKVKWYTIIEETDGDHGPGKVDLGGRTFKSGASHDLNNFEPRRHADIWVLYQMAIERVASMGNNFKFTTQVKVKYPHDGITNDNVEASYSNPTTKVTYIVRNSRRDDFNTDTLLHELGHIWAYNHSTGEICLTEELLSTGGTHGLVSDHCVAFHEGFAEWWKDKMKEELFGGDAVLPYNRAYLSYGGVGAQLTSLSLMQRHDMGWFSVFHTLTTGRIYRYDFKVAYAGGPAPSARIELKSGATGSCSNPDVDFMKVLRVFNEHASAGYPNKLSRDETTINAFLTRAQKILDSFSAENRDLYQDLVDPSKTVQPSDKLCR